MKLKYTIVLTLALVSMVVSCSKNKETIPVLPTDGAVTNIEGSISKLAANDQWSANDAIGLTMLSKGTTSVVKDVYNYQYYTPTTTGNFEPSTREKTIYFPQDGSEVTFRAYYPYLSGLQSDMKIPIAIADQTNFSSIDFMTAEHTAGFSKSDPNVKLNFHHKLCKVIFDLRIEEGQASFPLEALTLTLQGFETNGTYDVINETLTKDASSVADIVVPFKGTAASREGIILPRTNGPNASFKFETPSRGFFTANMSDMLSLDGGYQYTFHITFKETGIQLSVTLEEWIDGDEGEVIIQ